MSALPDVPHDQLVHEARGWVLDCAWREDPEDIETMSDERILAAADRHYVGGLTQLARDALLCVPAASVPVVDTGALLAELVADLEAAQATDPATHAGELGESVDDGQAVC